MSYAHLFQKSKQVLGAYIFITLFFKRSHWFEGFVISGKEPLDFLLPCLQSDPQCEHRRQAFPTGVSQVGHFFFRVVFYTINKTKPILKVVNYVAIGVDYRQK